MCLGFVKTYHEFVGVRAVLGICEGGLLPGMVCFLSQNPPKMNKNGTLIDIIRFYNLSSIYTRGEMALRLGLFYTAASLSGAFGGVLARGIVTIGEEHGINEWAWIFIIEGLIVRYPSFIFSLLKQTSLTTHLDCSSRCHCLLPAPKQRSRPQSFLQRKKDSWLAHDSTKIHPAVSMVKKTTSSTSSGPR